MEFTVRPYVESDRDAVRLICVATAERRVRSESRRLYLFKTACDYYLECEPENCFVAEVEQEDGTRRLAGYILCAEDCETYARRFRDRYLPKIKEYSKLNARIARTDVLVYGQYAAFFPAHFRLAVLPEFRGQGAAEQLVQTLAAHLQARRGKGMVVVLNKKNTEWKTFFSTHGFSELRQLGSYCAYGLDL